MTWISSLIKWSQAQVTLDEGAFAKYQENVRNDLYSLSDWTEQHPDPDPEALSSTMTREEADRWAQQIIAKTRENMGNVLQMVQEALSRVDWTGSPVSVQVGSPGYGPGNKEEWSDPVTDAYIVVGPPQTDVGFTLFIGIEDESGTRNEIDDVIEDDDMFDSPSQKQDYYLLVQSMRHPNAQKSNRILSLYTARPIADRELYMDATSIPSSIFLTTKMDDAEGFSRDYGGGRDIWKVRIEEQYLIKMLDTGMIRHYQSVGQGQVPVKSIRFLSTDERIASRQQIKKYANSEQALHALIPEFIRVAQEQYGAWDASDPEYGDGEVGFGGICHLIAEGIQDVIINAGLEASTVSASCGEQHVWVVVKMSDGIYEVDIPPCVYETGGGYSWQKIPDVEFSACDIVINRLSADPNEWDEYIESSNKWTYKFAGDFGMGDLNRNIYQHWDSGGVSSRIKPHKFYPAFRNKETGEIYHDRNKAIHDFKVIPEEHWLSTDVERTQIIGEEPYAEPWSVRDVIEDGFVDEDGKFYTRTEATEEVNRRQSKTTDKWQYKYATAMSIDNILEHLEQAIMNYIGGDWEVIRARRLMPSYLQKYGSLEMVGRNVKADGDAYYVKVFYEVRKRRGEIDYPPGYFADETYDHELGHQLLSFRGFVEGWKGPNAPTHEPEERIFPTHLMSPSAIPRDKMVNIGRFGNELIDAGNDKLSFQNNNPADTPFAVAEYIRNSIDGFWNNDGGESEETPVDPVMPTENVPASPVPVIAGKTWTRSDWIEMVGKVFELLPHDRGPFVQWTKPYLGNVSYINEDQDIRVEITSDMYPLGDTRVTVIVLHKDNTPTASVTKEWPGDQIAKIPYEIVHSVYQMIDNPENGLDNKDDDESPVLPVNDPVLVTAELKSTELVT